MITITELNIYPVKSCAGIALPRARLTATGFAHDREWLIVRPNGRFITQREYPKLALIATQIDTHALTLQAPGMNPLSVPLGHYGARMEVTCWKDLCDAFDAGDAASAWLEMYLGAPFKLVRFDSSRPRPADGQWSDEVATLNQFSDGFPWLVISEASLQELNTRLPHALPMNRFRPNIVISGVDAYDEDRIDELAVGNIRLRIVKGCTRCAITTTNQQTGEREGDEPLRTLRSYRFDKNLKGVIFGQNVIAATGIDGELAVGDTLQATWQAPSPSA